MKTLFRISVAALSLLPITAHAAPAAGLGVTMPLVGRLTGGGGVLYRTAVDITNNTDAPMQIDFYVDGVDLRTNATIGVSGSLTTGGFAVQGAGKINGRVNVRFDDIVDALAKAGLIGSDTVSNGFLGSALFVFDGTPRSGAGAVTARFYNTLGDGTVGVALKGREITADESQALVATLHDTRGNTAGVPSMYSNVFINNTGLTRSGTATTESVVVEVTAFSAATGMPVGSAMSVQIGPGKTAALGNPAIAMGVPAAERSIVIRARVTAGNATIQGLVSQVDEGTKDASAFEMGRGE